MREASTNKFVTTDLLSDSRSDAKSLFWKILAISPCGSIFCLASGISLVRKLLGMNILGETIKKNYERYASAKSQLDRSGRTAPGGQPRAAVPTLLSLHVCRHYVCRLLINSMPLWGGHSCPPLLTLIRSGDMAWKLSLASRS